jgi:micrococcal nuclease
MSRWVPLLILAAVLVAERAGVFRVLLPRIPESLLHQRQSCLLVQVVDGDTVAVRWKRKVEHLRLLRVDTPERGQPGHDEATEFLRIFLTGKQLQLEFEDPLTFARDAYGRLLVYLFANGENVNVEIVRAGWSRFWTKYGEGKYAEQFEAAEEAAKTERRGLWKDSGIR